MGETGLVKRSKPERDNRPKGLEVFYDRPSHTCGEAIKGKPCYNRICSSGSLNQLIRLIPTSGFSLLTARLYDRM